MSKEAKNDQKYAAIVDAYSAGNLLAPEFIARGVKCLHVQTTETIWPILLPTFRPDDFEKKFIYRGDILALARELSEYPLAVVLPGTETGVELADKLSEALNLRGNGTHRSEARRNKYLMVEAVREKGIRAAQQIQASNVDEVLAWMAKHQLQKIVIKPLKSAGTDSVAICSSSDEVKEACAAILGTVNKLGLHNETVLAQEYLQGTEYFINTVSADGKHRFTEIWEYQKRSINGRDCVYDCNRLLPYDGETSQALREYVLAVLDALEIKWGPAHTEVIITPKGPVLVELGSRLDGLSVPSVNNASIGYGPLDLTVDIYTNPAAFEHKTAEPYHLRKHARTVYLTSYQEGKVDAIPGEEKLRSLQSFFQMRLRVKPGGNVSKTLDYFTAPGFLTLVHEDPEVVENDYQAIRELEKSGGLLTMAN